jgi:site-specific DNA-methyltransferase (adenine-specific)/adenine-specific DNA-methyltransferase
MSTRTPFAERYELPETEKRDLIKLIEAGKPLPEKYRFQLFADKREVELVWNGKTRDVCTAVLPFQTLEHIDEPRKVSFDESEFETVSGRQLKGWANKLIWGDNKLILSSLKAGALRRQIEDAGGLKLIYIDPPFDVGADFSMDIEIGDETFHKEANLLEEIAFRDTWGRGNDSFISMVYERLILIRDLLHRDGSIYVHMGKPVSHYVRLALEEVFGGGNFVNEITWKRSHAHGDTGQGATHFGRTTETILLFRRSEKAIWNPQHTPYTADILARDYKYTDAKTGEKYRLMPVDGPGGAKKGNPYYEFLGVKGYWRYSLETMTELHRQGEIVLSSTGRSLSRKRFLKDAEGTPVVEIWDDVNRISPTSSERLDYPTQKPESLLERILRTSSNEGDLVADFFCGSGTTAAVAEKLGRKWIATDLGKFGIHTTRKRLIGVQRELKAAGKPFRAFEVLNLGRYERQAYLNLNGDLSAKKKEQALARKEREFRDLILRAYRAATLENEPFFHGQHAGRLVVVGPINLPVGRLFIEEVITECRKRGASRADVLAFEFEMGLGAIAFEEAKRKGIDLALKTIPPEVFDKRAVDKGQVRFADVSYIEATPRFDKKDKLSVAMELTDFSVYYSQGFADAVAADLKDGKSEVVCEAGKLSKLSKDKEGVIRRDVLTKTWTDWVDYWAVDFDYESRKEIIKVERGTGIGGTKDVLDLRPEEFEERETGSFIFENEWQSFRTRQNRELELKSATHTYPKPGRYIVAVKVIDIFGNDTMSLVPVTVG